MSRLFVCGDICNSMSEMKKSFISDELVEVIKSVDYSVCNLEGVEVDHNTTHVDYATSAIWYSIILEILWFQYVLTGKQPYYRWRSG